MQEENDDMNNSRNVASERSIFSSYSTSSSVGSKSSYSGYSTSKMTSMFGNLKDALMSKANSKKKKKINGLEARDIYPRMPWHDLQCAISGLVARDVAAHFVQVLLTTTNYYYTTTTLY